MTTPRRVVVVAAAALAMIAFCFPSRGARAGGTDEGPSADARHESATHDPYMAPAPQPPRGSMPPTGPIVRGSYVSVQVNVDELGQNIWADAANEPSIAVDPTNSNNIVIGWRQFDTLYSSFRQAGWAYSHDGGRTWTFPGVLEPEVFRSDPVLAADADGNFYYYSVPFSGPGDDSLFKSLDGGETWPDPVSAFGGDKPWMTIDRTGGMSHGNIYAAWGSQFTRSVDGGASFMEPVDSGLSFGFVGTVAVGPDGAVYIINTNLGVVRSANAQDPLSAPAFIPTTVDLGGWPEFGWPANPAGLMGQPWIAVDYSDSPRHGHVYVLSSVNTGSRLDVTFARAVSTGGSSDCCYPHDAAGCDDPSCEATICADAPECCSDTWYDWCSDGALFTCAACPAWAWSTPVRVNDDPADTDANHWFGMMSVAPSGRIDAVWNDTRNTGVATVSELFYAYSLDGGNTWSKNVALSPPFDTTVGWPQQWKIGDYYDMVSDDLGARVAYAATFNGEQDVYFLRIGQFDCNNNAVGDLDDIADGTSNDCSGNGIPDECEPDCNGNGVPDSCDIVDGTSVDCNGNGVPDACDLAGPIGEDCNGNGTLDSCDIAAGDSPDCNGNARPDECDLAGGDALDCNDNGVPDTCDIDDGGAVDCNGNTVPDACDIAFGPSVDMDGNGVPDECEGSVLYVNVDATGMQNGTTWADAYVDLQSALNTAAASSDSVGEIWVAQGMYRPDIAGGDREASFELVSGVVLYGGFAGGEDTLDERDPEKNPTTLSGDLNDDDIGFENRSDNSYHVVTAMDVDDTAVLDGFIVAGGSATWDSVIPSGHRDGGGMLIVSASPVIRGCVFQSNEALELGGAVFNNTGSPAFRNVRLSGNRSLHRGGAIANQDAAAVEIVGCTFEENESDERGGAVCSENSTVNISESVFTVNSASGGSGVATFLDGEVSIMDSAFVGNLGEGNGAVSIAGSTGCIVDTLFAFNVAGGNGGAIDGGGFLTLERDAFVGNEAGWRGGAIALGGGFVDITSCSFVSNISGLEGGALENFAATTEIRGCSFYGNRAEFSGGAMHVKVFDDDAFFLVADSVLVGNASGNKGGALWIQGTGIVTTSTIAANTADITGGIHGSYADISVDSSILWGNTDSTGGGEAVQVVSLQDGSLAINYTDVGGWTGELGGLGNIGDDPLFVDVDGPDDIPGTGDEDVRVSAGSPVIHAGDPDFVPAPDETDLDGHARVLCGRVDMGAYEFGIGDYTCDQTVDLADFASWPMCFTGPPTGDLPPYGAGCEAFDFNFDAGVDMSDYAGFTRAMTVPD